jgi:hypothetical protein
VQKIISKGEGDFARAHNGGVGTRQAAATHGLKVQYARTDIRKYRIHIFICSESGRVWNFRLYGEFTSAEVRWMS